MKTTAVLNHHTRTYETRVWNLPLVVSVCPEPDCAFKAIAVSVEAADEGLWQHTSALHLGGHHASGQ